MLLASTFRRIIGFWFLISKNGQGVRVEGIIVPKGHIVPDIVTKINFFCRQPLGSRAAFAANHSHLHVP
jgi:hypothetical protein